MGLKTLWSCNAFIGRTWGLSFKIALWLYKRVVIPKITYATVAGWDRKDIALARYYDHRGNANNSNKSAGDVLGSANTGNSGGVCSTDGSILPTEIR